MSGAAQGFGEHGAFTVSVAGDPRLAETVHELTRKAAEMSGCRQEDGARLADAALAVATAVGGDLDLAYRPTPFALVLELRPAGRDAGPRPSLHAALTRNGALDRIQALVPAAELQGTGADECCFLTCPRADAAAS
jgi:hypothetical protein